METEWKRVGGLRTKGGMENFVIDLVQVCIEQLDALRERDRTGRHSIKTRAILERVNFIFKNGCKVQSSTIHFQTLNRYYLADLIHIRINQLALSPVHQIQIHTTPRKFV